MRRPNVLLVTLDQWRADCLFAAGHPILRTPHMDALAADGVMFDNHFTVAAPCGPARASLLTGLYLHNHGSVRNGVPLDARHRTVAQEMRQAGYDPKLFGFTDTTLDPRRLAEDDPGRFTFASMAPGFSEGLHLPGDGWAWRAWLAGRGHAVPDHPRDLWRPVGGPRNRVDATPPAYAAEESETAFLTGAVEDFIAEQGPSPWFAHVSYFRPHHPYIAPEPYNRLYDPGASPPPVKAETPEAEGRQHPWLAAQLRRVMDGPAPVRDELPMRAVDEAGVAQLRALYYTAPWPSATPRSAASSPP